MFVGLVKFGLELSDLLLDLSILWTFLEGLEVFYFFGFSGSGVKSLILRFLLIRSSHFNPSVINILQLTTLLLLLTNSIPLIIEPHLGLSLQLLKMLMHKFRQLLFQLCEVLFGKQVRKRRVLVWLGDVWQREECDVSLFRSELAAPVLEVLFECFERGLLDCL